MTLTLNTQRPPWRPTLPAGIVSSWSPVLPRLGKPGAAILLLMLAMGCSEHSPETTDPQASHREEFLRIAEELAAGHNAYVGGAQLDDHRAQLSRTDLPENARLSILMAYAMDLLRLGQPDESVAQLELALTIAESLGLSERAKVPIHQMTGLAQLRRAEVANCIARHNAECCLFPIRGAGLHEEREPALAARAAFLDCLAADPNQLDVRWLLNLTAMTLGDWPDAIPKPYQIPPQAFKSEQDIQRFDDVAGEVGVDTFNQCGGAVVDDFDLDGHMDIITTTFDMAGPATFYKGKAGLQFEDASAKSRLDDQLGGLNCVAADYDGDGDKDLLILRGAWLFDDGKIRNSLMQNDGTGRFRDVTQEAGLSQPAAPTQAASFGDFDGDGQLDLYIANESRMDQRGDGDYPSQLFRNNGNGTFVDVAAAAGVTNDRYAKGVTAGDYDNDGDLDLYVSNAGPNRLYRNDGNMRFTDVGLELGVTGPEGRSFACWFFDVQNDGWLDLYVGAFDASLHDVAADALDKPFKASPPRLYINKHGTFTDLATESGLEHAWLPMGAGFGDIDYDGYLDIYLATGDPGFQTLVPNVMLRNDGGTRFVDVTTAGGFGHLQKGHGVAFADLDNDGDQDLYNQLGGFYPGDGYSNALFRNPGNGHHFLYVQLEGTHSNRSGYGARIKIVVDEQGQERQIHRSVGSVSSFGGAPDRQEIGLGKADRIVSLEVEWPASGIQQKFEDVNMNQSIKIVEGDSSFHTLDLD
ncbi:MAG: CRTAC1 family protein [Planctomycetota bacterium]|nr:CRTAC1 family protein [Planctomycetota bacterium]